MHPWFPCGHFSKYTCLYIESNSDFLLDLGTDFQANEPREDLLTIIKRCMLEWCGHVSCSSDLTKTVLQGRVKGGRRRGRHKIIGKATSRKWTGLEFAKSQRAVENGEKWKKLVVKSFVLPQQPPQLRERWWWWTLRVGLHSCIFHRSLKIAWL